MENNINVEQASELVDLMSKITTSLDKLSAKLDSSGRSAESFDKTFRNIVLESEELSKQFGSIEKAQKAVAKDAKVMAKFEESFQKKIAGYSEKKRIKRSADFQIELKNLKYQQKAADEKEKKERMANARLLDSKKAIDSMTAAAKAPGQAINSMLDGLSALPQKIRKASIEAGGFGKMLEEAGKNIKSYFNSEGGMAALGFAALLTPITLAFKAFTAWFDFIDKELTPATAALNKQIDATASGMGNLSSQANKVGMEFMHLGKSYGEGVKLVGDFASALRSVEIDDKTLQTGKELISILGLSAEEAGAVALQFSKQEGNLDGLNKMLNTGAKEAKAYRVPVNDVLRDLTKYPNTLARFGVANEMNFAKSAAKARSYGLDIEKINSAFGKQLDTFEGTSEAASKLNTVFGTSVNSYELMMETDPMKRMEILRKQLISQGKEWGKLNTFEKNVITSTMGVDEATAALALSSEKERKALQAKQIQREKQANTDERWNAGMSKVKETILALKPIILDISKTFADIVSKLLGFEGATKGVTSTVDVFKKMLGYVQIKLDKFNNWLSSEEGKKNIDEWKNSFTAIGKAVKWLTDALTSMGNKWETVKSMFKFLGKATGISGAIDLYSGAANAIGTAANYYSEALSRPEPASVAPTAGLPLQALTGGNPTAAKSKPQEIVVDFANYNPTFVFEYEGEVVAKMSAKEQTKRSRV